MSRAHCIAVLLSMSLLQGTRPLRAQHTPTSTDSKFGGSANVHALGHVSLGGFFSNGGLDIESEPGRPFVYVTRLLGESGFTIVNIADPTKPKVIYDWRIPGSETHVGLGGEAGKYFKLHGRYYYAKCFQFEANTADADLSMIVFDVTSLPDVTKIKEVARVHGGSTTHVFPYKHSDGRLLLFTTPAPSQGVNVYDAEKLVAGDPQEGMIGHIPVPNAQPTRSLDGSIRNPSYHDTYVAYEPASGRDILYGAGAGGYFVWDVSKPETPQLLTGMTAGSGVSVGGHTIIASPDGRYAVGEIERQFFPVMVFDLKPALDARAPLIPAPIGAFSADWHDAAHSSTIRWPYAFVASFEDGLQVVSMTDPKEPRSVGWYYTCECAHATGWGGLKNIRGTSVLNGAADVGVRNADGLIVLSDYTSGLWIFRMDGFDGWNGNNVRMPNISSEQDWTNGPVKQSGIKVKPAT